MNAYSPRARGHLIDENDQVFGLYFEKATLWGVQIINSWWSLVVELETRG